MNILHNLLLPNFTSTQTATTFTSSSFLSLSLSLPLSLCITYIHIQVLKTFVVNSTENDDCRKRRTKCALEITKESGGAMRNVGSAAKLPYNFCPFERASARKRNRAFRCFAIAFFRLVHVQSLSRSRDTRLNLRISRCFLGNRREEKPNKEKEHEKFYT